MVPKVCYTSHVNSLASGRYSCNLKLVILISYQGEISCVTSSYHVCTSNYLHWRLVTMAEKSNDCFLECLTLHQVNYLKNSNHAFQLCYFILEDWNYPFPLNVPSMKDKPHLVTKCDVVTISYYTILWQRSWSALAWVMACCLIAQSHYLN